jgi:hypothetical protein
MGICSLLLPLALIAMLLSACDEGLLGTGEMGSGNLITETREVDTFTAIELSGAMELDLIVDPNAEQSVVVTYDDNIIDQVVTRVSGDTLVLELEGSVNLTGGADRLVTVTMNELTALEASGATDVEATGTTTSYTLDASGASTVLLRSLTALDIDLDVSGASTVAVHATGTVRGSLSGASNLDVYGEPVSVLVDSSGASDLDIKN